MPSDAEQIATIRSQTLANIATITASPKPSYTIDGQTVSWSEYLAQLQQVVAWCDQQAGAQEPFELHTQGMT
jgi:hypothetical protein